MLAKFIPLREAAQIIGVSPKTLENWLAGGYFARTADGKKKWAVRVTSYFFNHSFLAFGLGSGVGLGAWETEESLMQSTGIPPFTARLLPCNPQIGH